MHYLPISAVTTVHVVTRQPIKVHKQRDTSKLSIYEDKEQTCSNNTIKM